MRRENSIQVKNTNGIALCIVAIMYKTIDVLTRRYIGDIVDNSANVNIYVVLVICILTIIFQYMLPFANSKFEALYTSELYTKIESAVLSSKQSELEKKNIGEISTCFTSDVNGLLQFAKRKLTIFLPDLVSFILCVFLLMKMKLSLGILTMIVGVVSAFFMTKLSKNMISKMNDYQNKLKEINKLTSDGLINVEMIKVNLLGKQLVEQYGMELNRLQTLKKKIAFRQAILSAPSMVLSFATLGTIAFYGGYCVYNNQLSMGSLLAAIMMADYIVSPIMRFENTLVQYRRSKVNQNNVSKIIEMQYENENIEYFVYSDDFSTKDVLFAYSDNRTIFNELNIRFEAGKINYIVGNNGIGKSTLIKLLTGVYEIEKGAINLPIKFNTLSDIRNKISVMTQDSLLFSDTIRNNILVDNICSEEKLNTLCKSIGLDSEINKIENGYNTFLQENGNPLSGGQKKRINFLRCVLREANVYIFDEPTVNIDSSNVQVMMDYILSLSKKHYVVVITHDKEIITKYPGKIHEIMGGK
ncbi:ABC transporter ATP-binding protein [Methanobrevibacter ruminantium]|uniref:ATP-binding cassette domain-containing protein n=1 Tax=Methanobrevibacter ruminantium TaxID=83816 RepID=UPI0026ED0A20|nr:ABC transporter ATP-binding protein [Methanobrevibacter ruminantium]